MVVVDADVSVVSPAAAGVTASVVDVAVASVAGVVVDDPDDGALAVPSSVAVAPGRSS